MVIVTVITTILWMHNFKNTDNIYHVMSQKAIHQTHGSDCVKS